MGIIVKSIVGGGLAVLLFSASAGPHEMLHVDFDNDGTYEVIVKRYGRIYIRQDDKIIFETPLDWDVREYMVDDFTNNDKNELALYLWKKGNYGPSLPFWITENDRSYKQHLFLYEWDDRQGVKPLWHSSNLPYINTRTLVDDFDGDGLNEIKVLERPYDWGKWGSDGQTVALWQWDEWGFKNLWRSEKGRYNARAL